MINLPNRASVNLVAIARERLAHVILLTQSRTAHRCREWRRDSRIAQNRLNDKSGNARVGNGRPFGPDFIRQRNTGYLMCFR